MPKRTQSFGSRVLDVISGNGPLILLVIMFITSTLTFGASFFQVFNLTNLIRQISITGIAAVGINFCIISGGRDLSMGAVAACASMFVAMGSFYGLVPSVLGAILTGVFFGTITGLIISRLNVRAMIATLGVQLAARSTALLVNGELSLDINENLQSLVFIGRGSVWGIPMPTIIFVCVLIVGYIILKRTRFGRSVYAVGGNEESATMMGVRVKHTKMMVYVVSGVCASIAGLVMAARLGAGQPNNAEAWSMTMMATVVIGGTRMRGGVGDMRGVIIGALICGMITNMINMVGTLSSYWQDVVQGCLLLVSIVMQTWSEQRASRRVVV